MLFIATKVSKFGLGHWATLRAFQIESKKGKYARYDYKYSRAITTVSNHFQLQLIEFFVGLDIKFVSIESFFIAYIFFKIEAITCNKSQIKTFKAINL